MACLTLKKAYLEQITTKKLKAAYQNLSQFIEKLKTFHFKICKCFLFPHFTLDHTEVGTPCNINNIHK